MEIDRKALGELIRDGQNFFIPFYRAVVSLHPSGIAAVDVKQQVRVRIHEQHGFDPFDESITGTYESTGGSTMSQIANNLISNRVLEPFMTVDRSQTRVMLYPFGTTGQRGSTERLAPNADSLTPEEIERRESRLQAARRRRQERMQ